MKELDVEKLVKLPVDWKYQIKSIVKRGTGETVNPHDCIVFERGDRAVPEMLDAYMIACKRLGALARHIENIRKLRERVVLFQSLIESNVPDTGKNEVVEPVPLPVEPAEDETETSKAGG